MIAQIYGDPVHTSWLPVARRGLAACIAEGRQAVTQGQRANQVIRANENLGLAVAQRTSHDQSALVAGVGRSGNAHRSRLLVIRALAVAPYRKVVVIGRRRDGVANSALTWKRYHTHHGEDWCGSAKQGLHLLAKPVFAEPGDWVCGRYASMRVGIGGIRGVPGPRKLRGGRGI